MSDRERKPIIGLVLGDFNGIGPEIIAGALSEKRIRSIAKYIIIGEEEVFCYGQEVSRTKIDYKKIDGIEVEDSLDSVNLLPIKACEDIKINPGKLSLSSGKFMVRSLKVAVKLALDKDIDAVVYGPLNKEAINSCGYCFNDELEFLKHLTNTDNFCKAINYYNNKWIGRVTSHIPLKDVQKRISINNILMALRLLNNTIVNAHNNKPLIAVSALNPHAGEGGLLGNEEEKHIMPAIEKARKEGIKAEGPFPSDTIFNKVINGKYDAILSMYHDQAQIALKLIGFDRAVSINAGLPIIVVTPSHGTAYDIAGSGEANWGSFMESIFFAAKIISRRLS